MLCRPGRLLKAIQRGRKAAAEIIPAAGSCIQPAPGNQVLQVDQFFITRMHGQTLVWRAVRVRRTKREHLPYRESRRLQKIDKTPGIFAQGAMGAASGQRCRVQQYPGAPVCEGVSQG